MLSGAAFQKSLLIYNAVAYSEDYALHHNERGNRLQRMTQWKRTGKIMINQQIYNILSYRNARVILWERDSRVAKINKAYFVTCEGRL